MTGITFTETKTQTITSTKIAIGVAILTVTGIIAAVALLSQKADAPDNPAASLEKTEK